MSKWRLIDTGFLNGYENMALDEALLLNFSEKSRPVLRLYGWEPVMGLFRAFSENHRVS